ncbi:MAG: hypothetical protein U0793_10770 [Gemmataceae bacterium]
MTREREMPLRLRLDLNITESADSRLQRLTALVSPSVSRPVLNARTPARLNTAGQYVICVTGDNSTGTRHVFAKVDTAPLETLDPPLHCPWTYATTSGAWAFDHSNDLELPVVALEQENVLTVWNDWGNDGYLARCVRFTPYAADGTECMGYGGSGSGSSWSGPLALRALPLKGELSRWAGMPEALRFSVAGAANLKCQKCTALNGAWVIRFDREHPDKCRWICSLPVNLFSTKGASVWRLSHHPADGYWYLDVLSNIDQAPGAWIAYRRHESAWDSAGANEMHLVASSAGLCELPAKVLLLPA